MNHQANWDDSHLNAAVWISDEAEGYVEATVTAVAEQSVTVQTKAGKRLHIDTQAPLLPPKRGKKEEVRRIVSRCTSNPSDGIPNMDDLHVLNEAEILKNIELRFRLDEIYTRTGPILIAMNPFKWLPIYGDDMIRQYSGKPYSSLPPHCYAEAESAYQQMADTGVPQSIVICGESGAGKTETTKLMLQYLSSVASDIENPEADTATLGDQMVQSNALMEAFGNAKTQRNNNSSRFGKFTIFNFDQDAIIMGGRVTEFLLEKTRVVHQPNGERNYHIFYQLLKGSSAADKELYELRSLGDFRYLRESDSKVDGMDDREEFEATRAAMDAVGMYPEEQEEVLRLVAAVLHIGNVEFSASADGESCHVTDPGAALCAARLLGVDATDLGESLTTMVRELPSGKVSSPVTSNQAKAARDALTKTIYSRLFNWVIRRINSAFDRDASNVSCFIGILDIFGFENMLSNGFEQLFINYTNEQLQYLFNETIFKAEEEEYRREQIQWDKTAFPDNTPCIELLSKRPVGLLPFMDSECARGAAATDEGLVSKWHKTHKSHANYEVCGPDTVWRRPTGAFTERTDFLIHHFAGPVIYSCELFIEKNRDALYDHIYDVVSDSSSPLVQPLFPPRGPADAKQQALRTVSAKFLGQMKDLVSTLQSTDIRFVRCIKTNEQLKPQIIDKANVLRQLICSGVTAALEVRRAGYPTRVYYSDFVRRFRVFNTGERSPAQLDQARGNMDFDDSVADREVAARMMTHPAVMARVSGEQYRLGLTKIFFQADVLQSLERIRDAILLPYVIKIQRWWISLRKNMLEHSMNRHMARLANLISRARMARVHGQREVKYALEEAAAAARYAKGLGLISPEVLAPALETLVQKIDLATRAVDAAINKKQEAARERALLLEMLDNGLVRLQVIHRHLPDLHELNKSQDLRVMVSKGDRAIDECHKLLVRLANQEDLSSQASLGKQPSVLKRSFTKAILMAGGEDDDMSTITEPEIDVRTQMEQVQDAIELVEQAEELCQQLLDELHRIEQARGMYAQKLEQSITRLAHARAFAEEHEVTGSMAAQNAFTGAREAIDFAEKALNGSDVNLFDSTVERAANAVEDTAITVQKEAEFRAQEVARNQGNAALEQAQKKYRQVMADGEVAGILDSPNFARIAAAASDALTQAAMLDRDDGIMFEGAANAALSRVEALAEMAVAEKAHKVRLDAEKREELRKLEPVVTNLASLKTKLEFSGIQIDDRVKDAVAEANDAVEHAREAIQQADSMNSVRSLITDAIHKVHASERILVEAKQHKDAMDRETARSHKALAVMMRQVENLSQLAEASGVTVSEVAANNICDAELAVNDAYRNLKKAESVQEIKDIVSEAKEKVDLAQEVVDRTRGRMTEVTSNRDKDSQKATELRSTLVETVEIARVANISDYAAVRSALLAAENALVTIEGRLAKPMSVAWLEHDGAVGDAAALREAAVKVEAAENTVLNEKRRSEYESRESRANQAALDFAKDRMQSLQAVASAANVENNTEVAAALSEARSTVEAAQAAILEGSPAVGKAAVDLAIATLDAAESNLNRARLGKEGQEKEKSASQVILDMCITKLQGVVATVDASGPVVMGLVEKEIDAATEALNIATRLLRRGEDAGAFAVAVQAATKSVDAADSAAFTARQRVSEARRVRNVVSAKFESLVETFEIANEKAIHTGVKSLPQVSNSLQVADNVLQLCRPRALGTVEDFLEDSFVVQRMMNEAAQKIQEAEEAVDAEALKREKNDRERALGRIDFERWLERHSRCVRLAEKWDITDVGVVQQVLADAEKEIEQAGPALRAGNLGRMAVLAAKVQREEEVIGVEKQKKERRQLELQRVRKELPALQRRVAQMESNVEASGPLVAILVEQELTEAQRALHQLEHYLDFGEHMNMLQPALNDAVDKIGRAEEACSRSIQRIRKARAEKLHEQNKLNVVEARFRETSRTVARFCAKSDHLRLQLSAEWSEMCWWGSQVKHTTLDGAPIGRGEVRPVAAISALAESLASAETAIATARQKVDVSVEEWLKIGATAAHVAVEEAVARVEHAAEVAEAELEKLQSEERERKAANATLDSLAERLSGITATANLAKISDIPKVADLIREAEHALQVVGQVLSAGSVAAATPTLKVAEKVVGEAAEMVASESSRKERTEAERGAAEEEVAQAKKKLDDLVELVRVLELNDAAIINETMAYADKAIQAAVLVLHGGFAPAMIAKEASEATKAIEGAERAVYLEKGRREQLARLRSHREMYARQLAQRKAEAEFRKHEEEMRRRREMQDHLEDAVHRLTVQWPTLQEARGSVVAAESAVDVARQKLARGGLSAANEAVRSAIERVEEAAATNPADAAAGASQEAVELQPLPEGPKPNHPPGWMQDYVNDASDYMGRTTSAFEAMTANMHFLTQGLLEMNDAIKQQNQVLNLQSNVLGGVGDREAQLQKLKELQQQPLRPRATGAPEMSPTNRWGDAREKADFVPLSEQPEAGAGF